MSIVGAIDGDIVGDIDGYREGIGVGDLVGTDRTGEVVGDCVKQQVVLH
jgi:hypothetical protein